jgi:hypothetical protein
MTGVLDAFNMKYTKAVKLLLAVTIIVIGSQVNAQQLKNIQFDNPLALAKS